MTMRTSAWAFGVMVSIAMVAEAQTPAPFVPTGGMGAGCPERWAHRDGSATSFHCQDVTGGAFCGGSYRATVGATQADEAAAVRAEILAMGFVIVREADEAGMHQLVYDDAAGHRIIRFVRRTPGRVVDVRCGSPVSSFAALTPTFVEVASTAR